MKKLRKMLGSVESSYIVSLMRLIETQSKATIAKWCINYAKEYFVPLYIENMPDDTRPQAALQAAENWMVGNIKLPEAKKMILECHEAARELEGNPAAQATARAIGQAASVIHVPTHSLGLAFYGAAAIAYTKLGINESDEVYDKIAALECAKMEKALLDIAVQNESNPAKINWHC